MTWSCFVYLCLIVSVALANVRNTNGPGSFQFSFFTFIIQILIHFQLFVFSGCVFNLDQESPKFPPHLFDATKKEIIQPFIIIVRLKK
jgi:hypothetical protein